MTSIRRAYLLTGTSAFLLLSGCNQDMPSDGSTAAQSESVSSQNGSLANSTSNVTSAFGSTGPAAPTTTDYVNATPSVAGTVSVIPRAHQTITVAFTSADGLPVSGLSLSNAALPADWSGPSGFTCNVADSGNGCVLTLTYAPATPEAGTLNVSYEYGNANSLQLATLSIPYVASASDNVVATPTPIGQITAPSGSGAQSVSVIFTTDDGLSANGLTILSDLSSLPDGWSTGAPDFSCAVISEGSGCQLPLSFAPMAAAKGTLTLSYGYIDHSGAARTGAVNVPYSTTVNGNVVAMLLSAGQINAIQQTGTQTVTVNFSTDDGQTAHNLSLLSPLAGLPLGWSSSSSDFACSTVATGNNCQLVLKYSPTILTSGTVQLEYIYTSSSGTTSTGFMNIPYASTTSNNVLATVTPSGEIDATLNELNPNVLVAFTTDDARAVTGLQLTTDLASLPAGWSSTDRTFSCASASSGTTCQLPLSYAPTTSGSGTLTLRYTYINDAGGSMSGSLNIPYRAIVDDSTAATQSQAPASAASDSSVTPTTTTPAATSGSNSPTPQITLADGALYSSVSYGNVPANGFYYLNNTYGHGNLVDGVDYYTRLSALQGEFPVNSTITWSWPSSGCTGCGSFAYGWPEFQYGGSNFGNPYNVIGPWPEQIKNLTKLTITYNVTLGGNLNSYDTLLDTFVTATSNSTDGSYVAEVSFFPQSNRMPLLGSFHSFASFGNACVGRQGKQIVIAPVTGTSCTNLATRRNIVSGTVDLHEIFAYLISQGLLTGNEYLRGFGLGPEMQVPSSYNTAPYSGVMTVNELSFVWE